MTKTTTSRQTATLSLLLSTLANYLVSLRSRNVCWKDKKEFAYATLQQLEDERDWHREDVRFLKERIIYNEAMCVVEVLLEGLKKALEDNPFPGQRKRLLPTATELFPDAEVTFEFPIVLRGEVLWRRIFAEGGISCEIDKISFPDDAEIDISEVELRLLQLVGEEGYLKVSEVAAVLSTKVRSVLYVRTREQLQQRGWMWGVKKVKGRVEKVVFPP